MRLKHFLEPHGQCDVVDTGAKAIEAFQNAHSASDPYKLICLDIKMPEKDGHASLSEIRKMEEEMGLSSKQQVKIFMATSLSDEKSVSKSYYELCDEYLKKPVEKSQLEECMQRHGLLE
jgi:two-component system chemotaxis response regulator CheY